MALAVETVVLLAAVLMVFWSVYQMSGPIATSPWLMPLLIAAAMALVAAVLIVTELRRRLAGGAEQVAIEPDAGFIRPSAVRVIGWLVLATGYAVVTPRVGFEAATLVFLIAALRFYGRAGWPLTIAIAVGMAFLVPVIFRYVFFTLVP